MDQVQIPLAYNCNIFVLIPIISSGATVYNWLASSHANYPFITVTGTHFTLQDLIFDSFIPHPYVISYLILFNITEVVTDTPHVISDVSITNSNIANVIYVANINNVTINQPENYCLTLDTIMVNNCSISNSMVYSDLPLSANNFQITKSWAREGFYCDSYMNVNNVTAGNFSLSYGYLLRGNNGITADNIDVADSSSKTPFFAFRLPPTF